MGFVSVGIVMLIVVFMFYMRMINSRFDLRNRSSTITLTLEKVGILESAGDDQAALKMAQEALHEYPDNQLLKERISVIEERLAKHHG